MKWASLLSENCGCEIRIEGLIYRQEVVFFCVGEFATFFPENRIFQDNLIIFQLGNMAAYHKRGKKSKRPISEFDNNKKLRVDSGDSGDDLLDRISALNAKISAMLKDNEQKDDTIKKLNAELIEENQARGNAEAETLQV